MKTVRSLVILCLSVALAAPSGAQTRRLDVCAALPRAEAERVLNVRAYGADALDDRLGLYRRQICRWQTEPGETLELALWTRTDGQAFAPLPGRAEDCDTTCLTAGREPNLYVYQQQRIGAALCVLRRPRPDRDLATGPITACTLGGARRLTLAVARKQGLAAAPMETVKGLLDRAGAQLR
jgi:hypothetical protein